MSAVKLRRQPPVKGGRFRRGAGLEKRINDEVERLAARFKCSPPMVMSTALADTFGIDLDPEARADGGEKKK